MTSVAGISDLLFLDSAALQDKAKQLCASYARALPFPHTVMDDFLPASVTRRVLEEFPSPETDQWTRYEDSEQKKLASRFEQHMGPATRLLLYQLNSAPFLEFLEVLTGIEGLIPDPYYGGGGLHQIERGGFLEVHADFNWHPKLELDRRLNLLIYLNQDWKEEFGGHLELWNRDMSRCEQRVLPVFNRCVVFSTTDTSFHGHPHPLTCPEGQTRKSIALYYYTKGRPPAETSAEHTTLFQTRPGEAPRPPAAHPHSWRARAGRIAERWLPPAILDVLRPKNEQKNRLARY